MTRLADRLLVAVVAAAALTGSLLPGCNCLVSHAEDQHTYKAAHARAIEQKKPLAVLVTAEWCPPCQRFKRHDLPRLKRDGVFDGVSLALVDIDKQPELASKLANGKRGVPRFVIFYRRDDSSSWQRKTVTTVSRETVRRAIKDVIAENR